MLGDRDPTYEDFEHLIYTQAVFKESLRLMPPVWSLGKRCAEPTALGDRNVTPEVRTRVLPLLSSALAHYQNPDASVDRHLFAPSQPQVLERPGEFHS